MWLSRRKTDERKAVSIQKHAVLTEAVLRSDYAAMRQIVAAGADLNVVDDFGMTPLLWAIMRGDIDAVRILLENGADPNLRPNPTDSPLWSAEDDFGMADIAVLLRSYGATK
jgi:uncharacterized protein